MFIGSPGLRAGGFLKQIQITDMFEMDLEEVDRYANTFTKEPEFKCPSCGVDLHTDWVDNGFGPYSVQASPYGCECGWHEQGCQECIKEKCFSWITCQGRAVINAIPITQQQQNALESAAQDKAVEVDSED